MEFSQLVSYTKVVKKIKTDLLLIISSFRSYEDLIRHFSYLSRQTYQNFNVLLVLGIPFDDQKLLKHLSSKKFKFGIILAKENERRGCSGGFFTGQKYALEQGYKYIIMADDDCMPVDPLLVGNLVKNKGKKWVTPIMRFVTDGYRKRGIVAAPTSYSLFSVEILEKYGLYFLPLFHGADDAEFTERVKEPRFQIQNHVEHPYNLSGQRLFKMFDRSWLFLLQALIIIKSPRAYVYNLLQFVVLTSTSLFFLPAYGRKIFFTLTRLLLTYTYGKKAADQIKSGYEKYLLDVPDSELRHFTKIKDADPAYTDRQARIKLFDVLKSSISCWRKQVVVLNTYSVFKIFFLAACAKKLYFRMDDGKCLLVADNPTLFVQIAKLAVFSLFFPAYAFAIFVIFSLVKTIRQPNTYGYGLD